MLNLSSLTTVSLLAIKVILLVSFAGYFVFSVIFLKKIQLLSEIIETEVTPLVLFLTYLNPVLAVVSLILTAVFL